jgi:hypothetical protein
MVKNNLCPEFFDTSVSISFTIVTNVSKVNSLTNQIINKKDIIKCFPIQNVTLDSDTYV